MTHGKTHRDRCPANFESHMTLSWPLFYGDLRWNKTPTSPIATDGTMQTILSPPTARPSHQPIIPAISISAFSLRVLPHGQILGNYLFMKTLLQGFWYPAIS